MGVVKKITLLLFVFFIPYNLSFPQAIDKRLIVKEVDGTPSVAPAEIKFDNGSLTASGVSVTHSIAGFADTRYLKLDQSTPQTVTASPIFNWGTATRVPFYSGTKTLTDDADLTFDGTILSGGDFKIPSMSLGTPTYSTVNDFFRLFTSAGRVSGGLVTDAGSGNVAVAAGTGVVRVSDDDVSQVKFFNWSAQASIATTSNTVQYIKVEYNGGSPQAVITNSEDWDLDTSFPLAKIVNEAGVLHILNNPWWVSDGLTNVIERIQSFGIIARDEHVGGLMLSVTGTRNVAVTAGTLWSRLNEFPFAALNTAVSGTVETYWYNGVAGTWTEADVAQYPVTQWNDTTLATLQTMTGNFYANFWVYLEADDSEVALIYPQAQYATSAQAEAETAPTVLPDHIRESSILIGRILFKKSTDAPVEVQSAFITQFTPSLAADHGNLTGLTDDDHTQYLLANGTRALTGNWAAGAFDITGLDDVGATSFTIGANSLTTSEFGYLDGQNQAVKTTSSPTFANIIINGSTLKIGDLSGYQAIGLAGSIAVGDYNIMSNTGDTNLYINRPTGKSINFRANNSDQMVLDQYGQLSVTGDQDTVHSFGRAKVGNVFAYLPATDYATFSHYDNATIGNYALYQSSVGETGINSKTGQQLRLCTNNAARAIVNDYGMSIGYGETAAANATSAFLVYGEMSGDPFADQRTYELAGNILEELTTPILLLGWLTPTDNGTEADLSGQGHTVTYTDASNFTTSDQLHKGFVWTLDLDGVDDVVTVTDADDLSFGNGTTDSAFSIGGWFQVVASATNYRHMIAKWTTPEYTMFLSDTEKINFWIYDNSVAKVCYKETNSALSVGWHFIVCTYNGAGGGTAGNGITIYIDGLSAASTTTNDAGYVAMENGAANLQIGASGSYFDGDLGMCFVEASELSAADVWKLYIKTRGYYNL